MDVFQEAAKAAQGRCGEAWLLMAPQEQTRAIYEEMRRIDQEMADAEKSAARRKAGKGSRRSLAA
jgi:hypothetical protein